MLSRIKLVILSSCCFAAFGTTHAQTANDEPIAQESAAPLLSDAELEPRIISDSFAESDLISTNSVQSSFEPAPFQDAYALGFITDDSAAERQELTPEDAAKIKKSMEIPKTKADPRYKPEIGIRAGDDEKNWRRDD